MYSHLLSIPQTFKDLKTKGKKLFGGIFTSLLSHSKSIVSEKLLTLFFSPLFWFWSYLHQPTQSISTSVPIEKLWKTKKHRITVKKKFLWICRWVLKQKETFSKMIYTSNPKIGLLNDGWFYIFSTDNNWATNIRQFCCYWDNLGILRVHVTLTTIQCSP